MKHKEEGNALYKKANYRGAIDEYSAAIALTPENSAFYNNRGNRKALCRCFSYYSRVALAAAYLMVGQTQKAIEDCRKAVLLDGSNAKAMVRLGKACLKKGLFDEAINSLKRALQVSPTNTSARNELNEAQMTQRRLQVAQGSMKSKDYKHAIVSSSLSRHNHLNFSFSSRLWQTLD